MVVDHVQLAGMKEMAISEFKAKCLAALEEVRTTGESLRVTRRGKPVVEVVPVSASARPPWWGVDEGSVVIHGDIVEEPACPPEHWEALGPGPYGGFDDPPE